MPTLDTRRVQRRPLTIRTFDDYRAELDRIEAAHHAGTLRTLGNWSAGGVLNHLASWIDYPYDGFPPDMKPPFIVRFIAGRLMRKKFIYGAMPPGFRIPKVEGGTFATGESCFESALARLRASVNRLERQAPPIPSPLFGAMSHDEWRSLHLGHANLHLGFLSA